MGQQFGDLLFDEHQCPPDGVKSFDPTFSEMAHHVAVVMDVLDSVDRAAIQLRHITRGQLAQAPD